MKSPLTLAIVVTLAVGYGILAAQQPSRPGEMTQARVFVENRNANDAIPVSIETMPVDTPPLRVEVIGTPGVALVPSTVVSARVVRQVWEHRVLTVAPAGDVAAALSKLADDNWEAVGFQVNAQGATTILLKRPR
jgi:hypothetical protein